MAIVFDGNKVKNSPEVFPGVVLKSYIHPEGKYHDGYSVEENGEPGVGFSFGLFTIEVGREWPATRFEIAEVSYILEGEGEFICEGVTHKMEAGFVIYIPKGEVRVIRNTGKRALKYLCIVDPAWRPEYEEVLGRK